MIFPEIYQMATSQAKEYFTKIGHPMTKLDDEIDELKEKLAKVELKRDLYRAQVFFFGVRQHPEQEREEFTKDKFGFRAFIQFTPESAYEGSIQIMNNLTEVHYLYNTHGMPYGIAFESDIHCGGRTCKMKDIAVVNVVRNTAIHNQLYTR